MTHAAIMLAQKGLAVFPCWPRGKQPATKRGLKDATTDPDQIESWWRTDPNYNVAIATGAASNVFVVDIDDAESELRRLETAYGELPETVESLTARGRHVWFRMPPDAGVRNSASRIARGIDVRGTGGYVLAPPSVHPSGRKYAWSVDSASAFAAAPPWLLQRIATPAAVAPRTAARITSSAEWQQLSGDSVGEGARNETLTRITGHLLRHYIDPLLALALVRAWNAAHCLPPLPESEVTRIVNSIASIEMRRRGRGDG